MLNLVVAARKLTIASMSEDWTAMSAHWACKFDAGARRNWKVSAWAAQQVLG